MATAADIKPPSKLLRKLSGRTDALGGQKQQPTYAAGKANIVRSGTAAVPTQAGDGAAADAPDADDWARSATKAGAADQKAIDKLRKELGEHADELAANLSALGLSHVKVCVEDPTDQGQTATQHLRALYDEAPPVGVTLVVTSTTQAIATFCRSYPDTFRERTVRVVHMGGAMLSADVADGEPTGTMVLSPDPAAQNNSLDMEAARTLYEEAQRLSVPLTIVSRHVAHAVRVPVRLFDHLGTYGGHLGETLLNEQKQVINDLYKRACSSDPTERRGLPPRCNREWFAATFCKGASLGDGEDVWSKVETISLYNPLCLLAAIQTIDKRYLAEVSVSVRSATHAVIGSNRQRRAQTAWRRPKPPPRPVRVSPTISPARPRART